MEEKLMEEGFYENHPALEYDRRGLSGVYIFDTFPGEEKRQPTAFEDCTPEKQEEFIKSKEPQFLQSLALILARKLKEIGKEFNLDTQQ